MVGLERTKFLDPLRFSYTIHSAEISPVTAHSDAPSCRHTHTPSQQYTHHLCTHTHTHTPLHTLSHTAITPTHTHPCSNIHITCAHLYTYLQISTNIKPTIVKMPIYEYLQISTHAYLYKISTNILTITLQYLSFKCLLFFFLIVIYLIYCYNILGDILMDYNDHIDNSDEDHS